MKDRIILASLTAIAALLSNGCGSSPASGAISEVTAPNQILDFNVLYKQNCAGCHGVSGRDGVGIALADPVFLAIVDDTTIRRTVRNGVHGTPMSAFAQSAGGELTDQQIDVLVHGLRSWAGPTPAPQAELPSFEAKGAGDAQRGQGVFRTYCSSCHGENGKGGKAGSVVDSSFLALVSDQELRLNVILGRSSAGAPDWRNDVPGHPMSEQEITDVVAWLAAQRTETPGQPYPISATERAPGGIQ